MAASFREVSQPETGIGTKHIDLLKHRARAVARLARRTLGRGDGRTGSGFAFKTGRIPPIERMSSLGKDAPCPGPETCPFLANSPMRSAWCAFCASSSGSTPFSPSAASPKKARRLAANQLPSLIHIGDIRNGVNVERREDLELMLCQTPACTADHAARRQKAIADYREALKEKSRWFRLPSGTTTRHLLPRSSSIRTPATGPSRCWPRARPAMLWTCFRPTP